MFPTDDDSPETQGYTAFPSKPDHLSIEDGDTDGSEEETAERGERYAYACPLDHQGNTAYVRGWRVAERTKKPPLLLVHDIGETVEMYRECGKTIKNLGVSCYAYDQRGHGRSGKRLGYVDRFSTLVKDLLQVASWVRKIEEHARPIIVGQGIGALVALQFVKRYPNIAQGLVISAPTFALKEKIKPWRRFVIKAMGEMFPTMRTPKGLQPRFSNPFHREIENTITTRIYETLVSSPEQPLSMCFTSELLQVVSSTHDELSSIHVPTLILLPQIDEVADTSSWSTLTKDSQNKLIRCEYITAKSHNGFTETEESLHAMLKPLLQWMQTQHG